MEVNGQRHATVVVSLCSLKLVAYPNFEFCFPLKHGTHSEGLGGSNHVYVNLLGIHYAQVCYCWLKYFVINKLINKVRRRSYLLGYKNF
jgi:hypothetical protein